MENTAKLCKMCGKQLTLDNFRFVPLAADKHASVCKECASAARKSKNKGGEILNSPNSLPENLSPNSEPEDIKGRLK